MSFLTPDKLILVLSDLHLGAGEMIQKRKNILEDFFFDKELIEFLNYYSSEKYEEIPVELVINGDLLDFLAIPFVPFFDDEFWNENASLQKLQIILKGHEEVFTALHHFILKKNKKIIYIIGNHDAELILPSVKQHLILTLTKGNSDLNDKIIFPEDNIYYPDRSILIKHGHSYESAHNFNFKDSLIETANGNYFLPPWGTYYVTRIVNKFKEERSFISAIRPVKTFIIYGLIFDTLFTIRFLFANIYYFFMVIFISYIKRSRKENFGLFKILGQTFNEAKLFQEYEHITREDFQNDKLLKTLIVGHTHIPLYRNFPDGTLFINTGSWIKMFNLDFSKKQDGPVLTYATITFSSNSKAEPSTPITVLNQWSGTKNLPYKQYL